MLPGGCGSANDAPAPAASPTGYFIGKADLSGAQPRDICTARNPAFLRDLLLRVTAALPPGTSGFAFEDFGAQPIPGKQGMTAVLHFRAASPGGSAQPMFAAGPFDPESCIVGVMHGGAGSGPDDPALSRPFVAE